MANEIELTTINELGTSWVDISPGAISTGYQAQNTNLEASFLGLDASSPYYDLSSDRVIIPASGIIEEGGLPFVIKSTIIKDVSGMVPGTKYYLILSPGSSTTQKTLGVTTTPGVWDSSKFGYYNGTQRVLNWVMIDDGSSVTIYRRQNAKSDNAIFGQIKADGVNIDPVVSSGDNISSLILSEKSDSTSPSGTWASFDYTNTAGLYGTIKLELSVEMEYDDGDTGSVYVQRNGVTVIPLNTFTDDRWEIIATASDVPWQKGDVLTLFIKTDRSSNEAKAQLSVLVETPADMLTTLWVKSVL